MLRLLLLLLVTVGLLGCATARKRADVPLVRRIQFQGTRGGPIGDRTDYLLRGQMAQRASPPFLLTWPLSMAVDGALYRPNLLPGDKQRVETYLAHHGWLDAEVTWRTKEKRRDRRKRAGVYDLIGEVELGPTTRWVARPRFVGTLPAGVTEAALEAQSLIRKRRRFRLDDVDATEAAVLRLLHDRGYANATAVVDLEVRPDAREAEVTWTLDVGPRARLGAVTLGGADLRFDTVALDLTELRAGQRYNETRLDRARETLYGTGAFSRVDVEPAPAAGAEVPVLVQVEPGRPRQIHLGARLGWEGKFFKPEVEATWTSANLGQRLTRVDLGLRTGFGYTPSRTVPLAEAWIRRTQPRLWFRGMSGELVLEVESDVYELITARTDGRARTRLAYRPHRAWTLAAEPQLRWTRLAIPRNDGDENAISAALGPEFDYLEDDFDNQYLMVEAAAELIYDDVVPLERRQNGLRASLRVAALGQIFAGSGYQRMDLDVRGYLAPSAPLLGKPVQLLARATGRRLFSLEDTLPYPERLFLGGASQFRGFRVGQVGPYDCVCVPRPVEQGAWWLVSDPEIAKEGEIQRHYLPRGGQTSVALSGEAQLHRVLLDEVSLTAFAEVAALVDDPRDLVNQARVAVGGGIRYDTAVGPFRLDVGVRPIYPEDQGPSSTVGCDGYAFRRRAFDVVSEIGRFGPLDRQLPAINIFISLGEAW